MFRYLTVLLFLLILFPLVKIGDASSVSAQSFTYEDGSYWLPDIEIKGNEKKVICNCCGESFYDEDALNVHIRHNSVCADYYGIPYEQEDGDDDAEINPPYNPIHKKNDDEHLFRNDLPAKSMRQNTRMNCVPTAIANMLSHIGSMQSAEDLRNKIEDAYNSLYASDFGDIQDEGIQQDFLDVFIRSFGFYHVGLSEIVSCIDFGRPCLGVIETTYGLLHMVEIVGYFDNG